MSATTTTGPSPASSPKTCVCLPYKDALVITAQALSIVGLFLSWSTVISILFGLVSFIMYQVVWCCRMNRCGLITAGVFAAISGVCCIVVGALIMSSGTTRWCTTATTATTDAFISSYGYDDDIWSTVQQANEDNCQQAINIVSGIGFGGGITWIACAVCTFVFVCGPRYAKFQQATLSSSQDNDEIIVVPVASTAIVAADNENVDGVDDVEKGQRQRQSKQRNETEKTMNDTSFSNPKNDAAALEGSSTTTTTKKKTKKKKKKKNADVVTSEEDVAADDDNKNVSEAAPGPKKKKKKKKKPTTPTPTPTPPAETET